MSNLELENMVGRLIQQGYLRSGKVIKAFKAIPRHLFVPAKLRHHAYEDRPLPIGCGQTISAPHMVAIMTELLDVQGDSTVLEVGTGSGYQAAILSQLTKGKVTSLERLGELSTGAFQALKTLGCDNVEALTSDGSVGYPPHAPYDRVIVTAASPTIPKELVDQLADGGRLLIPLGSRYQQTLIELVKDVKGEITEFEHGGCVFVPLIGEKGWTPQ